MRVVISIGGSVLAPDLDPERVADHAAVVADLVEEHEVAVVVGGGSVAREYIGAARDLGANEMELDRLGIGVTRLNARLLLAALRDRGVDVVTAPPEEYDAGHAALSAGQVPVMGGTEPGHTTDAVSTALAEDVGADRLVFATSAPGVFDADPVVALGNDAGTSAPVDPLASLLLQRSGLEAVVVDGSDPDLIGRAARGETVDGTRIVPDGEGEDRLEPADGERADR